ncbi:MAG TPA: Ig-like domain-containing protein [Planctomycetota bacterium]|nr:Ig-like domain-containing protein [Planctomycetota bacterium]
MDHSLHAFSRRSQPGNRLAPLGFLAPLAIVSLVSSCGGGGGGSGGGGGDFQVNNLNLQANSIWPINRAITIEFSQPVDFSTVNPNSINIRQLSGTPAIGEFRLVNATTVSFQPICPLKADYSDAGLLPGGVAYEVRVVGQSAFSVRSTSGDILSTAEQRLFVTPNSTDPGTLFFDTVPGSPTPLIRSAASITTDASYVEIGGDPSNRVYFERANNGVVSLENGFELPHNLLSDVASHAAFLIAFNQPVDSSPANLDPSRIRLEFLDQGGAWQGLTSLITLESNCVGTGALLRIEPQGALPSGSQLRIFLAPEFRDIVGETNSITQTSFAPSTTSAAQLVQGDSLEEEFIVHGIEAGSHEDIAPPVGLPIADWGGGALTTAFGFSGTGGGGNGDFDWEVKAGQMFVLDTTNATIVGGPNFAPTTQQVIIGGVLDLRNFRVVQGGTLRIQGPNPVTILASGSVVIDGVIEVSGSDSHGVSTLLTPQLPEPGAAGVGGGGRGGTGSPLVNTSDPKGANGVGAFGIPDLGGTGGEASFWTGGPNNPTATRGSGGGGGALGPNQLLTPGGVADQTFLGLDAEPGFNNLFVGNPPSLGALSGQNPPKGGAIGRSPFTDVSATNDFFGNSFDQTTGLITVGELSRPWAGGGGGGGGDAIWSNGTPFPPPTNANDRKGAGGGGGAGSLQILSLGTIKFGATGAIKCRGGTGGGGENSGGIDRVGGGSGGGSGGHVILQTAGKIDLTLATGANQISIIATGGQGGAGVNDTGGAKLMLGAMQETQPSLDACPSPFTPGTCQGPISGAGGDGGPGIIQLHTPGGLSGGDILLPPGRTLAQMCKPTPVSASSTQRLIPTFGRASVARSIWIPMGLGGFDPAAAFAACTDIQGNFRPATFDFGNVNTITGEVLSTAGVVNLGPTLLGPANIAVAPNLPFVTVSGRTLVMDASPLIGGPQEYFLHNPSLLKRATLRLSQVGVPSNNLRFDVVAAAFISNSVPPTLTLTVAADDPQLTSFSAPGGVATELIPTYFKIRTSGVKDSLPPSASVFLKFQAAPATSNGLPNAAAAVPPVPGSDIAVLNADAGNPCFRFLRFQVEFDIDKLGQGITPQTPLPSLDFLRLPFRY